MLYTKRCYCVYSVMILRRKNANKTNYKLMYVFGEIQTATTTFIACLTRFRLISHPFENLHRIHTCVDSINFINNLVKRFESFFSFLVCVTVLLCIIQQFSPPRLQVCSIKSVVSCQAYGDSSQSPYPSPPPYTHGSPGRQTDGHRESERETAIHQCDVIADHASVTVS